MALFWIFLFLLFLVLIYFVSVYNRFQRLKNGAEATLGQIKVALKKRLDLLSQLIENVKSYASFERETLEKIVELRSSVFQLREPKDVERVDRESKELLGNILVTFENYPDLKTSLLSEDVNSAVKSIEDEISRHRYTYNNIVQEFNTMLDTFPSNIIGSLFGFKRLDYLKFGEEVEERPNLNWN